MRSLPKNYILALVIFLALLLWIGSGFFKSETNNNLEASSAKIVEEKSQLELQILLAKIRHII